ncbi:hypothetical protein E2C01_065882 [Portunus trituberculatus]|uniref:Uncharacterized protein n=1 Tax=Portunus trituberculatus TaxID=210409 RepID=A0A5B7HPH8_PORTR|nr:hypothetical protein [Portunus trituberculatus]
MEFGGGAGGMQAAEQGVASFTFTSAPHAALFMKKVLCAVVTGYSEDTGGFRLSKGPCGGNKGPAPPTTGPGVGVMVERAPPPREPPPAVTVAASKVAGAGGAGGRCGWDTGTAA